MAPTIFVLLGLGLALLIYKLVYLTFGLTRNTIQSRRLGCKPPPWSPSLGLLGIKSFVRLLKADKEGVGLDYCIKEFDLVSQSQGRDVHTLQSEFMGLRSFVTRDPKNIQALLATQFKDFELGPIRYGTFSPLLGHGIFSADGKYWEHSRALLRPQFSRTQISDLDLEEKHVQNLLKALPHNGSNGWTDEVDLVPLFFRLTMDSATEFLFGESVQTQLAALNQEKNSDWQKHAKFAQAFDSSQECIADAFRLGDFYFFGLSKKLYNSCHIVHKYIDSVVQRALATQSKPTEEKYVFLEQLIKTTSDPVEIRDQLLSILLAGRDTTAGLLSFLFLTLAQKPEIYGKLRGAVLTHFGTGGEEMSFDKLKSCQYLQWCVNEALRLYPSVPLNSRRSTRDTTLPRGGGPDGQSPVFVPKGTEVNYIIYATHRAAEFWGDGDTTEYIPERWMGRKTGFEFLPFNGGPRICLGQQFALTQAAYVAARISQCFDSLGGSSGHPEDQIRWSFTLTGRPKDGVKVRLHKAEN